MSVISRIVGMMSRTWKNEWFSVPESCMSPGSLTTNGDLIPPSETNPLNNRLGDILAWAQPGPVSMYEFLKPRFARLLSNEFMNASVWPG